MDYPRLYNELPKEPIKWNVQDIQVWLQFIGLNSLYDKFRILFQYCRLTLDRWQLFEFSNRRRPKRGAWHQVRHHHQENHVMYLI